MLSDQHNKTQFTREVEIKSYVYLFIVSGHAVYSKPEQTKEYVCPIASR